MSMAVDTVFRSSYAGDRRSVLNVEGIAEGLVESDPAVEVEVTDGFWLEKRDRNCDQVVAADDTLIGKALIGPDFNLRADTTDRSGDRRARNRGENGDGSVTSEDADGPPPGPWAQISPDNVAALYHSGAVSEASLEAAETMAGCCGCLR